MAQDYYSRTAATRLTLARAETLNANTTALEGAFEKLPTAASFQAHRVNYALDTGAVNAYVVTLVPAPVAYSVGMTIDLVTANGNTGAATINVNGLGVRQILDANGVAVVAGMIPANRAVTLKDDGIAFRVHAIGTTAIPGDGTVTPAKFSSTAYANQSEAETGSENTKVMTALRVKQHVDGRTGTSGDVLVKANGANVFSQTQTISNNTAAVLRLKDGDATTDKKNVIITCIDGTLRVASETDAAASGATVIRANRGTGTAWSSVDILAPALLPSGSAANPSLAFNSDTDTGLRRPDADDMAIVTGGTDRVHVSSQGAVRVGGRAANPTDNTTFGLIVNGTNGAIDNHVTGADANLYLRREETSAIVMQALTSFSTLAATISINGTTGSFNSISDATRKTNPRDFNSGAMIDAVASRMFEYLTGETGCGPMAQDMYAVCPWAVTPGNDLDPSDPAYVPWMMDPSKLVGVLWREVQSMRERLSALEGDGAATETSRLDDSPPPAIPVSGTMRLPYESSGWSHGPVSGQSE